MAPPKPKTACADPYDLGPHAREPDAPNASYCRSCSRRYQRDRYHINRLTTGQRINSPRAREEANAIYALEDEQGPCGVCGSPSPGLYVATYQEFPIVATCSECARLLQGLKDNEYVVRLTQLLEYLRRRKLTQHQLVDVPKRAREVQRAEWQREVSNLMNAQDEVEQIDADVRAELELLDTSEAETPNNEHKTPTNGVAYEEGPVNNWDWK